MSTYASIDNPEMTFPAFNMNGNSPQRVGQQYKKALEALGDLENAFCDIEFHSRDYYTLPPANWDKAVEERTEIKKKMADIRHYLEALTAHCFESAR